MVRNKISSRRHRSLSTVNMSSLPGLDSAGWSHWASGQGLSQAARGGQISDGRTHTLYSSSGMIKLEISSSLRHVRSPAEDLRSSERRSGLAAPSGHHAFIQAGFYLPVDEAGG